MVRSVSTSPHAWALREVDASRLVAYREAEKESFRERHGFALSYVPFFVQIVCDALLENPYLNSTWTEEGIVLHHYVHMGIAVALPDSLIVPVIKMPTRWASWTWRTRSTTSPTARGARLYVPRMRGTFTLNNTGAPAPSRGSRSSISSGRDPEHRIHPQRPVVVDEAVVVRRS